MTLYAIERLIDIIEPAYRRRGLARTVLSAFLHYATNHDICAILPTENNEVSNSLRRPVDSSRLLVRIGELNTPSIALFTKLGFSITKGANVFGEIEMRYTGEDRRKWWGEPGQEITYPE